VRRRFPEGIRSAVVPNGSRGIPIGIGSPRFRCCVVSVDVGAFPAPASARAASFAPEGLTATSDVPRRRVSRDRGCKCGRSLRCRPAAASALQTGVSGPLGAGSATLIVEGSCGGVRGRNSRFLASTDGGVFVGRSLLWGVPLDLSCR